MNQIVYIQHNLPHFKIQAEHSKVERMVLWKTNNKKNDFLILPSGEHESIRQK